MKQNNANGRNIFLVPNADVLADLDFETWLPLADGHKREQLQSMTGHLFRRNSTGSSTTLS